MQSTSQVTPSTLRTSHRPLSFLRPLKSACRTRVRGIVDGVFWDRIRCCLTTIVHSAIDYEMPVQTMNRMGDPAGRNPKTTPPTILETIEEEDEVDDQNTVEKHDILSSSRQH